MTNVSGPDTARQGKVHEFIKEGLKRPGPGRSAPLMARRSPPPSARLLNPYGYSRRGAKVYGVFSYSLSGYRIVTAGVENIAGVAIEEFFGHAGGEVGAELGTEICIAAGVETGGLLLILCGIGGGAEGGHAGGCDGREDRRLR